MQKEKIVLESPAPLSDGGKSQTKICIIGMICGMVIGLAPLISTGTFRLDIMLIFGVLGLLIGWGIKNKVIKYKSSVLRRMQFKVENKLSYQQLYQELLPVFSSLNIKMEINKDGSICIPYDGLLYDVIFNEDDSFIVFWRQTGLKMLMSGGYYISIYKRAVVAMGIIAYHVQKVCQNEKTV